MAEHDSGVKSRQGRFKRVTGRVLELITVAAIVGAILYFPATDSGRVLLGGLVVASLAGLFALRRWPR